MFGISFAKLVVLVAVVAAVWFGFKYLGREERVESGRRRPAERTMGERLRRATRKRSGDSGTGLIEDTEECPVCKVFVAVESGNNCGKPNCPY